VKTLARDQNLTLIQARDRECPGRDRIVRVWCCRKARTARRAPRPPPRRPSRPRRRRPTRTISPRTGMRLGPDGREETIPAEMT
jgi:hypothetical protein